MVMEATYGTLDVPSRLLADPAIQTLMHDHAWCAKTRSNHRDIVHARLFPDPAKDEGRVPYSDQALSIESTSL